MVSLPFRGPPLPRLGLFPSRQCKHEILRSARTSYSPVTSSYRLSPRLQQKSGPREICYKLLQDQIRPSKSMRKGTISIYQRVMTNDHDKDKDKYKDKDGPIPKNKNLSINAYWLKCPVVIYHLRPTIHSHKDKDRNKDKLKLMKRPNMCRIF